MNIICDAKELKKVCQIGNEVHKHSRRDHTNYLDIDTTNGKVVAMATNQEQMVLYNLKAEVLEKGVTSIPIRRSLQFANYEKAKIRVRTNKINKDRGNELLSVDGKLENGARASFYNADFKGAIPIPAMGETVIPLPNDFQRRMRWTLQCVAVEESRPILTGVVFDYDKEKQELNMVSADGFRLIKVSTTLQYGGEPFRIIIPQQAVSLVTKYTRGKLKFGFNNDRVWFEDGDMTIISQVIQGVFPKYQMLIPDKPAELTLTISAPIFSQRLSQIMDETPYMVRMSPTEDGMLKLTSKSEELEDDEVVMPATIKGEGHIAFCRRYLLEASKIFSEMVVEITQSSSPMKIYGDLQGVTIVVMPMFVQW